MLNKIILKNFKNNLKNYLLFFASNTLAVTIMLIFWAMKYNLGSAIKDEGMSYALNMDFMIATVMMAVVAIFLTLYAIQHYIKLRIRDYSMLKLLGIRRKVFLKLIFAEYSMGWGLSFIVGLICGNAVYYVFQNILYKTAPKLLSKSMIGLKPYLCTLGINIGIVIVVILTILTRMDGKNLDTFAAGNEIKEMKFKNKKWLLLVLLGFILFGVGNYRFPIGDGGIIFAQVLWLIAMFLILSVGGSLLLEWIKHKKRFYLKNLFRLNQLCHHYSSNYMVIFMLFVVHFFALSYLATALAGCFPIKADKSYYPYDYIWTAQEKDQDYIGRVVGKYKGTAEEMPLIRVATLNQLDHFGISASSYEKLTGKKCKLSGDEVMVLVENKENGKIIHNKDSDFVYGAIHIGKSKGETVHVDGYENYGFHKFHLQKIVTGNIVGQLADGWRENWIIFSDKDFTKYRKQILDDVEEPSLLALFKFPEQYKKQAGKELSAYAKSHGVKEIAALQNSFYNVGEIVKGIQSRALFAASSKIFLAIALLFSSIFVLAMKAISDEDAMKKRYTFLECMGMRRIKRIKGIRFEIQCVGGIPLILGGIMGINYALVNIYRTKIEGEGLSGEFWKVWSVIIVFYVVIQIFGIEIIARKAAKNIEQKGRKMVVK